MDEGAAGASSVAGASKGDEAQTSLELIRVREAELSGRVLSAKREADEIVADARRQAAEIIDTATEESGAAARESGRVLMEEADGRAKILLAEAEQEASGLSGSIGSKVDSAVEFVIDSVIGG